MMELSEWKIEINFFQRIFFRTGLIYELIHDLFTGRKLASNVLVSFCAKFKKNIVFNETTSNYNYANYVSSIMNKKKSMNSI